MKRIIIGDPHGRWRSVKKIYDYEQPDEVIILGDYFDSFNIDAYEQRESYNNIIELRKNHLSQHKGKFDLLIGNHDFHYIDKNFGRCSGWNQLTESQAAYPLCRDYDSEILKFVIIDEINKTIYSHAGVSMNWFNQWVNPNNLSDINTIESRAFCFTYKDGGDFYGSSSYNSPLWIRPEGLRKSPYKDSDGKCWTQVFGHTETCSPLHLNFYDYDFYCIDCINRNYLVEELDDNYKILNRYIETLKEST